MSKLPNGWSVAKLGEVCLSYETRDPEWNPTETITYIDIGSINNRKQTIEAPKQLLGADAPSRARRLVKSGDVLFSSVRTYLKNIAMVPPQLDASFASTGLVVLRASDAVDPSYLFQWVKSDEFVIEISKSQDGTLYPAVNDSDVYEGEMPLAPLSEQRRIVAKVDGLTARTVRASEELSRVPSLLGRYKRRLLALAFSGELTAGWRLKAGQSVEWSNKSVGELITNIVAGKNLKCDERPPRSSEKGVIKISAVTWGDFDPREAKTLPSSFVPPDKTRIKEGDFLISRANTLELVAAVVIVKNAPSNLFLSDKVLRLEMPNAEKPWLLWFLRSPQGRTAIEARATGNQLSMRNLSQRNLLEIEMPWPGEDERAEIVRRIQAAFDWLDRLTTNHAAAARLLPKLDALILAKAFRGELVPQDPNDEPARILLERVKAVRPEQPRGSRVRTPRVKGSWEGLMTVDKNLEQVLIEADDWVPAQTAFQRCGIGDGAPTEDIERLYSQLRSLDADGKLETEVVTDSRGRKLYDRLRLRAA